MRRQIKIDNGYNVPLSYAGKGTPQNEAGLPSIFISKQHDPEHSTVRRPTSQTRICGAGINNDECGV